MALLKKSKRHEGNTGTWIKGWVDHRWHLLSAEGKLRSVADGVVRLWFKGRNDD